MQARPAQWLGHSNPLAYLQHLFWLFLHSSAEAKHINALQTHLKSLVSLSPPCFTFNHEYLQIYLLVLAHGHHHTNEHKRNHGWGDRDRSRDGTGKGQRWDMSQIIYFLFILLSKGLETHIPEPFYYYFFLLFYLTNSPRRVIDASWVLYIYICMYVVYTRAFLSPGFFFFFIFFTTTRAQLAWALVFCVFFFD